MVGRPLKRADRRGAGRKDSGAGAGVRVGVVDGVGIGAAGTGADDEAAFAIIPGIVIPRRPTAIAEK